jgi:hypothetical protein
MHVRPQRTNTKYIVLLHIFFFNNCTFILIRLIVNLGPCIIIIDVYNINAVTEEVKLVTFTLFLFFFKFF